MTDSTLHVHHPELTPTTDELAVVRKELQSAYDDYTRHVSPQQMAIALETATYTLWAARQIGARSAVDFGSGFTSYVLRQVCDDVVSVDDSPEWLEWTKGFLSRYGYTDARVEVWDDYKQTDRKVDLVVYDFSGGAMRDDNFQFAVGQIASGGIGIMDDANHEEHQKSMRAAAQHYRYELFGLQDYTRDWFRRFAALIIAP
jgi:predicted O-methyltransferase YrrM